ncbi:multi-sensor hybrid histidine kinase [Candidatus Magnetomorum sp. HK-1]|nr:multi-sensor hybrid histidine kinase [Candidatus Magnetomorum sp. HK-1]
MFLSKKATQDKHVSIARRLSTSLVLCIFVIGLIFISLNYLKKMYEFNALLLDKAEEYKKLISSSIEIPLWDIDRENIREIGKTYMQNNLICRLFIFDSMNRIIFNQQKKDYESPISLKWDITHENDKIGHVEMDVSSTAYKQKNEDLFISGIETLLLVIILISLTTGFFLNTILKKPFRELNEIVESYSSGHYAESKTQTSYVEFKQFVFVLNEMAQKIIKQNENLELRVIERTQKLNLANKELKKLAVLADEANKAKSEFLTNVSHELRTPMNAIMGMATILMDLGLNADQKNCVNIIYSSANDLLSLINDLLDLSSLDTGKLKLENVDFDLIVTVNSIIDLFSLKAKAKNLKLTHAIEYDVPTLLKGDPGRLQQVLANLIDNGIKFTETGTIHLDISLQKDHPTHPVLCFSLKDTGIGIHQQDMKYLFKIFSQVDASITRRYGGTGLGLVISKKLLDLMKGEINVKTKKDKGSTFWFTVAFEKQAAVNQ